MHNIFCVSVKFKRKITSRIKTTFERKPSSGRPRVLSRPEPGLTFRGRWSSDGVQLPMPVKLQAWESKVLRCYRKQRTDCREASCRMRPTTDGSSSQGKRFSMLHRLGLWGRGNLCLRFPPLSGSRTRKRRKNRDKGHSMQKPWRDETFNLNAYPRCAAYLKSMNCRVDQFPISDYYAAVILADTFEDADFEARGIDYSVNSGSEILSTIESMFLGKKSPAKPAVAQSAAGMGESDRRRLMAFLGSRGVRTSMLKTDRDIIDAAEILWPTIKGEQDCARLLERIRPMSKAQRKTANAKNLPDKWKAC